MGKGIQELIPFISDDLTGNSLLMVFLPKFEDIYDRKDLLSKIQVIISGLEQQPKSGISRARS